MTLKASVMKKDDNLFYKKKNPPTQNNLICMQVHPYSFKRGYNKIIFLWPFGFSWKETVILNANVASLPFQRWAVFSAANGSPTLRIPLPPGQAGVWVERLVVNLL